MKDIYRHYQKDPKGVFIKMNVGIEWRFARMIFGSFLINVFKETLTPVIFGHKFKK